MTQARTELFSIAERKLSPEEKGVNSPAIQGGWENPITSKGPFGIRKSLLKGKRDTESSTS